LNLEKEAKMPISRKEFDSGVDRLSAGIIKFLKAHPDEAFAIEELAEEIGGKQFEIWAALHDLKSQEQVQRKCIKGKSHYCIGRV
jgi:hypothetical protein